MGLLSASVRVLRRAYGAEAFNIGANIGVAAGAGVVGHVHVHVLPRWSGDTNFMATTAETRVIPESIEDTYNRLLLGWQEFGGGD
jgi:ATP adenylyltransferase